MGFRLVPNSVTLNSIIAAILHYFIEFGSFPGPLLKSDRGYTDTFCECNVAQRIYLLTTYHLW